MYIFLAILMFSLLIFVHELGHFVTAKLSGVQVNEFSMFMGPAIFKKQVGETLYAIRCIPFGGYCAMEGEDEDTDNPRSFQKALWWKRLIILLAGAFMNFVTGWLIFALLYGLSPYYEYLPQPVIDSFYEGNAIEGPEGLQVGDEIYSIDGERVYISSNVSMLLSLNLSDDPGIHDIVVIRDGEKVVLEDFAMERREFDTEAGRQLLYGMNMTVTERTPAGALRYAWANTVDTVRMVRLSLGMLISGQAGLQDMSGPAGIVDQINQIATESETVSLALVNVFYFTAFIGVNLAVMNLLPIPALDGGRAVCVVLTGIIEAVTKKKLNPKYETYLHGAGMVLLLGLMAVITFKDIFTIFRR